MSQGAPRYYAFGRPPPPSRNSRASPRTRAYPGPGLRAPCTVLRCLSRILIEPGLTRVAIVLQVAQRVRPGGLPRPRHGQPRHWRPRLPRRKGRRVGRQPPRGLPVLLVLQHPVCPRRPQPPVGEPQAVAGRCDRVEQLQAAGEAVGVGYDGAYIARRTGPRLASHERRVRPRACRARRPPASLRRGRAGRRPCRRLPDAVFRTGH